MIATVLYVFGSCAGAHVCPAVSVSPAVVSRLSWIEVVPCALAQLAGALTGAVLVVAIFGSHMTGLNLSGGTIAIAGFTRAQAGVGRRYAQARVLDLLRRSRGGVGSPAAIAYDLIAQPEHGAAAGAELPQSTAGEVEAVRVPDEAQALRVWHKFTSGRRQPDGR